MATINTAEHGIAMTIQKKLGRSSEYGQRIYGSHEYGEYNKLYGIYQLRRDKGKQIVVQQRFYIPTNPQTESQQENRQKFAVGVLSWQELTDDQKDVYNERAKYKPYSGYNLFLTEYLLSN